MITANPDVGNPEDLERIVPGDIFFYGTSEDSGGKHILIVAGVDYKDSDTRVLTPDRIRFIESVYYTKNNIVLGRITNNRNLSESDSDKGISNKNWYAIRLKD